jgi:TolB-like protein
MILIAKALYGKAQPFGSRRMVRVSFQPIESTAIWIVSGCAVGADRLRITVQLVQVKDQSHLWAEDYEYVPGDILG